MGGSLSSASTWNGLRDIGMARMTGRRPMRRTFAMERTKGRLAVWRASCPFGVGVAIVQSVMNGGRADSEGLHMLSEFHDV